MTTINVSSSAQLVAALTKAHAGDTIMLAGGTYSGFTIRNVNFASDVTIESASATNKAVLTGFQINNSSGITLKNVTMNATAALNPYYAYEINNSSHITLDHVDVHGLSTNLSNDLTGLLINGSQNVTVSDSQFHQLKTGISQVNNTNLTIEGNSFSNIQVDGIDGGGSSYVSIENNSFTDFHAANSLQHPDAIQFWTTNTKSSAHDITISGNSITVGSGDQTQGIFITDQVGTLPYENLTITHNTIVGEMYNAIYVQHANDVTVSDNMVTAAKAAANLAGANMSAANVSAANVAALITQSWIGLSGTTNATVTGNDSSSYNLTQNSNLSIGDNAVSGVQQAVSVTATGAYVMGPLTTKVTLTGDKYASAVGNALNDTMIANNAGDRLVAGSGTDILIGGTGNDTLVAGSGSDTMTGGAGKNTFVFGKTASSDTIKDFGAGSHNVLDLSAMIAAGMHPVLHAAGSDTQITFSGSNAEITLLGVHSTSLIATSTGYTI